MEFSVFILRFRISTNSVIDVALLGGGRFHRGRDKAEVYITRQ